MAVTSGSKVVDQVFAIATGLVVIAGISTVLLNSSGAVAVIRAGAKAFTDAIKTAGQF